MALTKIQIIETICNQTGFPKNKSYQIAETLLEIIKDTLASRKIVTFNCSGKLRDKINGN